jgi:DNA-binding transcriptional LysR family regulator
VAEFARAILADRRQMLDAVSDLTSRKRALKVASVSPKALLKLTLLVAKRFPGVAVDSVSCTDDDVMRMVLSRDVDLAISAERPNLPTVRALPIMDEHMVLFVPPTHPLAARSQVHFDELDGETFLIDKTSSHGNGVFKRHLPGSSFLALEDRDVLRELINASDIPTFANSEPVVDEGLEGRVRVPISDADAHATYYLVCLDEAPVLARQVMDAAEQDSLEDDGAGTLPSGGADAVAARGSLGG